MFSSKYYYLITGLPDISLDDNKHYYTSASFKEYVYEFISDRDKNLLNLFYLKYDNANLLKLLKDKEAVIDDRGVFTSEELLEYVSLIKNGDKVTDSRFPSYMNVFLEDFFDENRNTQLLLDDRLSSLYYMHCMKSSNKFISKWFEFNLDINNLNIAIISRKHKLELNNYVLGENEVVESIRTSTARDFGISTMFDYYDEVVKISEMQNLVDKERKLDEMKWNWIEEATFFDHFTVEQIFVFLIKIDIIERWSALDKDKGDKKFRNIIDSLKNEVQIPSEFR